MCDDSQLLLKAADHFSNDEWQFIKQFGPTNFDCNGLNHAILKPDPMLPDFLIIPMRESGAKKSVLQRVYVLNEIVKHIFYPQSSLPLTCTSDNSTVYSKQIPYDLAFKICQYLCVSMVAKATTLAPIREAPVRLEPGIVIPPHHTQSRSTHQPVCVSTNRQSCTL